MTETFDDEDEALATGPRAIMLFEPWAEVSIAAAKWKVADLEARVAEEGLTMLCWSASNERWLKALSQDLMRGEFSRIERYATLVAIAQGEERVLATERLSAEVPPTGARETAEGLSAKAVLEAGREPLSASGAPHAALVEHSHPTAPLNWEGVETSRATDHLESTLEAILERGATMPFGLTSTPEFQSWLNDRGDESGGRREANLDLLDATALGTDPTPRSVLPFIGEAPSMPLDLYASLCAALTSFPERANEILARFQLHDQGAKDALDRSWQRIFAQSPSEVARWQDLFTRFCAAMTRPK